MLRKALSAFLFLLMLTGCIVQTPIEPGNSGAEEAGAAPVEVSEPTSEPTVDSIETPIHPDVLEGMVWIPATEFMMGCDPEHNNGYGCPSDELPRHKVSLSAFAIDIHEVTNAEYAACVAAGACAEPQVTASKTREDYYLNAEYADFPMANVRWDEALAYCQWAGKRLPTEAEWELAARGTSAGAYAWGDAVPDCSLANVFHNPDLTACVGDTVAVGSYPQGASAFGVMDMTGNVWEWVADSYLEDFYTLSPIQDPLAEADNVLRVVRGGGWSGNWLAVRVASRAYDLSLYRGSDLGFRCAQDWD